jgi:hypothetical protein
VDIAPPYLKIISATLGLIASLIFHQAEMVEVVEIFSVLLSHAIVDLGFSRFVSSFIGLRDSRKKFEIETQIQVKI